MNPIQIYPKYAFIINYDIKPGVYERYFRWIMNEFLPALQNRRIYRQHVWLVVGGKERKPERQIEFITEDLETLRRFLDSSEWDDLEGNLLQFIDNYSFRVVKYSGSFKV